MKQKLFCLGDDFVIKNDTGEDVFFVDGKVFTIGNKNEQEISHDASSFDIAEKGAILQP